MSSEQCRKLLDLRVVDLRLELEKRGLDKTGVKAVLTERLQKALEDEGLDPAEYVFDSLESPGKKPGAKKSARSKGKDAKEEDGEEEDEVLDDSLLEDVDATEEEVKPSNVEDSLLDTEMNIQQEEALLVTQEDGIEVKKEETDGNKETSEESMEVTQSDDITSSTVQVEKVEDSKILEEASKDDSTLATDQSAPSNVEGEKSLQSESKPEEQDIQMETSSAKDSSSEAVSITKVVAPSAEEKMEGDSVEDFAEMDQMPEDFCPDPLCVTPINALTVEDKIKMDTSMTQNRDDHESLVVHVDDTQNDLDADIMGEGSKESKTAAEVKEDAPAVKAETSDEATKEPAKADITEPVVAEQTATESSAEATSESTEKAAPTPLTSPPKTADKKVEEGKSNTKSTSDAKTEEKEEKGKSGAGRNLWVSGLSSSTRATDLKSIFSKYGKVVGAKVVTNARSPGSRCYGFVTMHSADEATKCIQHLHRTELHGKMISVERAKNEPGAQSKSTTTTSKGKEAERRGAPTKREDRGRRDSDRRADDRKTDKKDDKGDAKKDEKVSKKDDKITPKKDDKKDDRKKDDKNHHSASSGRKVAVKKPSESDKDKDKTHSAGTDKAKGEPAVSTKEKPKEKETSDKESEGKEKGHDTTVNKDVVPGGKESETSPNKDKDDKDTKTNNNKTVKETEEKDRSRAKSTTSSQSKSSVKKPDPKAKKTDKKEVLSFDKIKEERERERMRQRERRLREEERARRREVELEKKRQRDVHMKQRAEAIRLGREREKLRREREQLEKEKVEAQRLEKLRLEQLERERLEREREEKRRQEQFRLEAEQMRRLAMKRPYESRSRDDYWSEPKRAAVTESRFPGQQFGSDRFNTYDDSRESRYTDRQGGDQFERKVERYDRRENRNTDNRDNRSNRSFDDGRRERDNFTGRDREDRRTDDRFDRFSDRSGFDHDRDRGNARDDRRDRVRDNDRRGDRSRDGERRGSNSGSRDRSLGGRSPQRDRADWKSERDGRQSQTDTRMVVRGSMSNSGGRDSWQGGSGGSSLQEDRNRGRGGLSHNPGPGILGNAPSNQRNWGTGSDNRSKMDNNWSSSRQTLDNRSGGGQQQERWSGGSLGLQQDSRQQTFGTQLTGGMMATGVTTNMVLSSLPQATGMVLTNPTLTAGRQAEPRFDAYKNMQTHFRRY